MKKQKEHVTIVKPSLQKDHWQIDVGDSVFPRWSNDNPRDSFLPAKGSERPQPHVKINECDY